MDSEAIIRPVEVAVFFILSLVAVGLELWAFADCARHKANAFEATGKRTKGFWLALTGGAALIGVIRCSTAAAASSARWDSSAWQL